MPVLITSSDREELFATADPVDRVHARVVTAGIAYLAGYRARPTA